MNKRFLHFTLIFIVVLFAGCPITQRRPPARKLTEDEIKNIKQELLVIKKKFTFKTDEFKGGGWYYHKRQSDQSRRRDFLATPVDANGYIYLQSHFYDDDWLFHTKVMVKVGDAVTETDDVPTYSSDHVTEIFDGGKVSELVHYTGSKDNGAIKLIAENVNKTIKVRFLGRQKYHDMTLEKVDKTAIKDCYELAKLLRLLKN